MAISIDKLREKLKQVNDKRGGGSSSKWFPKDLHVVRILPIDGQEEPYKTLYFHYLGKQGKPLYCPNMNDNKQCDICDMSAQLKEWNDDKPEAERKADFKMGCSLEAGPKHYFAMVERKTGDDKKVTLEGPFWWSTSEAVWKDVVAVALDNDLREIYTDNGGQSEDAWALITDTKTGFDLEVDLQKKNNEDKKGNTKQYNLTKVKGKPRALALSKDAAEVEKLLSSIPAFDGVEKVLTSEDVSKALADYLDASPSKSDTTTDGTEKVASNNAEKPASGKKSVDDALNDLLGK